MSLVKESQNPTVLEASAGAIQNLCAGHWNVRTAIFFDFTVAELYVLSSKPDWEVGINGAVLALVIAIKGYFRNISKHSM